VLDSIIRTSTAVAESYKNGTTLFDHDPHARGARDYANATDELLQRIQQSASEESTPSAVAEQDPAPPTPEAINSKV
jgi:chromosome partitioning protein